MKFWMTLHSVTVHYVRRVSKILYTCRVPTFVLRILFLYRYSIFYAKNSCAGFAQVLHLFQVIKDFRKSHLRRMVSPLAAALDSPNQDALVP